MRRKATAVWQGSGKDGKGNLSTQSEALKQMQYSYKSRFEEGTGTNPEELIAAAHSGCFTMKLSFNLDEAGFTADKLETTCTITLENGSITSSHLELSAQVPGIDDTKFQELVQEAKSGCPVSKLLNADISVSAKLNS